MQTRYDNGTHDLAARRATLKAVWTAVAALSALSTAASAQVVEYYHLDAIGNVRAVSNQAGQITRHHDYLPFGEEWNAQADPQPLRVTGKERDSETGLDYFEARYYHSMSGRFTAVDPVRTLGAATDPQQWNRYAYARNNPLRYLDPHGLYVFDPSATNKDKDAFRNALASTGRARDNLSGSDGDAVGRAIAAYGTEGEENGVTVGFGSLPPGEAGKARAAGLDPATLKGNISVTLDLKRSGGENDLAIAVAHEGSHVADYQAFYAALVADPAAFAGTSAVNGGPLDLTSYATEIRAYNVSAFTARGFGFTSYGVGGQKILNGGRVDAAAIGKHLSNSRSYKLTAANPGPRISGQ